MNNFLYPLQGNSIDTSKDTVQTIFKEENVRKGIDFAYNLEKMENFPNLKEAILSIYKLTDISEYDNYRTEIVSELYDVFTKWGTDAGSQNDMLNKIVHQSNIDLSYDLKQELNQELKQEVKQEQHFTLKNKMF